jgi:phage baseplate assembly protein W
MDAWHDWGGDLEWSATGDLRAVEGSEAGRQRVLRRLLTAEGSYIWVPDYGAGLPLLVGEPNGAERAEATSRRQMLLERVVSADPLPQVSAKGDALGAVVLNITYQDADTGAPVAIGFTMRD